jgi:hypothetical protein
MARKLGEGIAVQVGREVRAHHVARLLAHVLGAALGVELRHLRVQDADLLRGEEVREEKITVAVELRELLGRESHRKAPPSTSIKPSILYALAFARGTSANLP